MEGFSAASWCEEALDEWATINELLLELRFTGQDDGILRKARIRRAEGKKAIADIKGSVAMMVQDLMKSTDRGTVTIEIPEIQLDVRLTWNEKLSTT